IGICQTVPKENLHIGKYLTLHNDDFESFIARNLYTDGTYLKIDNSKAVAAMFFRSDGSIKLGTVSADDPISWPANKGLYINNNGDVGLGTESPGATLEVNGTVKVSNYATPVDPPYILVTENNGRIGRKDIGNLLDISDCITADENCNVHIGALSTGATLDIHSNAGQWGYSIISRVNHNQAKAYSISNSSSYPNETFLIYGNGNIWTNGGIRIGDMPDAAETGTIRWNSVTSDFEGNTEGGTAGWKSLTGGSWSQNSYGIYYNSGHVAIGKESQEYDYPLDVCGTIRAEEMRVNLYGTGCDYVFEDSYKLMPVNELEAYIDTVQHLPDIPSAVEMQSEDGVPVGQMQIKLLLKIEELTLYIIQQNKRIEKLEKEINELKK
ncbi:MAG: hypothetical protein HY738_13385, partial [Bacteroidia bacterium]|nr:hypothetical protein [Bacteroidia bacterium]